MSTEAWIYTVWKYGQDKNECLGDYAQENAEKKLAEIGGEDFGFISKQQIFISGIGGVKMNKTDESKKDQVTCSKCGRIVGCDISGKKHKCPCSN